MIDVSIINSGFTGIILGALLSKKGIKVKILSSQIPEIIPFYQNDIENGVMSKVLGLLEVKEPYTKSKNKITVNLKTSKISLGQDIESFKGNLISEFQDQEKNIDDFIKVVKVLGEEWSQVIDNEFVFDWKKSENSIKYSNLSYKDFLNKIFAENIEIREVLLAIAPVYDVSLNTMAGYLYTQVFDGCNLKFGINGVIARCLEIIGEDNISYSDEILKIEGNKKEELYEIEVNEEVIKSKYIVDTRAIAEIENSKFSNENLSYLSLEMLLENKLKGIEDVEIFWNGNVENLWVSLDENQCETHPFVIWNDGIKNGREENRYRADIIVNKNSTKAQQDVIIKSLLEILEISGTENEINIFTPKDYERQYGVNKGTGIRWAFTKEQSMKNPFKIEIKPNYFSTSKWGFAWFTAALTTYYQLSNKLRG